MRNGATPRRSCCSITTYGVVIVEIVPRHARLLASDVLALLRRRLLRRPTDALLAARRPPLAAVPSSVGRDASSRVAHRRSAPAGRAAPRPPTTPSSFAVRAEVAAGRREGPEHELPPRIGHRRADRNRHRRRRPRAGVPQMPRHDVVQRDLVAARHDHRALDGVLQLAHVARPVVRQDPVPRRVVEVADLLAVLAREALRGIRSRAAGCPASARAAAAGRSGRPRADSTDPRAARRRRAPSADPCSSRRRCGCRP